MTDNPITNHTHPVIIIMGVTGSGKTTIGELLAEKLSIPFYDADDFHPKSNQIKLANDIPLNDDDRQPWLDTLIEKIVQWSGQNGAVLACSSLKHKYRSGFRHAAANVQFIFLYGDYKLIAARLRKRAIEGNHIIKDFEEILNGQYRDLEIPTDAIKTNIDQSPPEIVQDIIKSLIENQVLKTY